MLTGMQERKFNIHNSTGLLAAMLCSVFSLQSGRRHPQKAEFFERVLTRLVSLALVSLLPFFAHADDPTSQLTLRDAIYLYKKDIRSLSYMSLAGFDCDVLQLVLDVESGYTDLAMFEGSGGDSDAYLKYPDRIEARHPMFAYALYRDMPFKSFDFYDARTGTADSRIGTATLFGYCFSTKPSARVVFCDDTQRTCVTSDGASIPY